MADIEKFKNIVARYCDVPVKDMNDDMRFREDLGFSSLSFMSFLGDLEDEYDVDLEEVQDQATQIHTIGEAIDLLKSLTEE